MTRTSPNHWLGPLLAILVAQIAVTFLARLAPTLAPALSVRIHWDVTDIGLLSSIVAGGSIIFSLVGLPLVLRAGPVRSLQTGLLVGAVGALLYAVPTSAGPVIGSFLLGVAAGPQSAAGSDVLRRYAPAGNHNLIFSIKQAGVPIAGVLAGLLMPGLAVSIGLAATFWICALLAIVTMLGMQPLQRQLDETRDPTQAIHPRLLVSLTNLRRPLRALADDPNLRRIAVAGTFFAIGQGVWFTFLISYLVLHLHMSLPAAGASFALMQAVSAFGRPAMGWVADRLGARTILKAASIASALTTVALALLTSEWPSWAVVALMVTAGATVSSWNGVQGAQTAHFARPGAVAESTTGASLLIFLANIVGPAGFGAIVALGGDFRLGFWLAAVCTLAALIPLSRLPGADR